MIDVGWSVDAERNAWFTDLDREPWIAMDPTMRSLARSESGPTRTFTHEQLACAATWYCGEHMQRLCPAGRGDSFLYTIYAPIEDPVVAISLHRAPGARPFSERERRLVDLFHRECRFLHEAPRDLSPAVIGDLSPRLEQTLRCLVRGLSEKQVAAELRLSPHTVHDYVKALYRHFGVQSRSELFARCMVGRS